MTSTDLSVEKEPAPTLQQQAKDAQQKASEFMKTASPQFLQRALQNGTVTLALLEQYDENNVDAIMVAARFNPNEKIFDVLKQAGSLYFNRKEGTRKYSYARDRAGEFEATPLIHPLFQAAVYNNEKVVEKLLNITYDINQSTPIDLYFFGSAALRYAAKFNLNEKVTAAIWRTLQSRPAYRDYRLPIVFFDSTIANSPLFSALKFNRNAEVALLLVSFGFDVNYIGTDGNNLQTSVLHIAGRYCSDPRIITTLIQKGARLDRKDSYGITPFYTAAAYNTNLPIIEAFIANGGDVNTANLVNGRYDESGPLLAAVKYNSNEKIVNLLIESGAKLRFYGLYSPDYLYFSSQNPNVRVFKILLESADSSEFNLTILLRFCMRYHNDNAFLLALDYNTKDLQEAAISVANNVFGQVYYSKAYLSYMAFFGMNIDFQNVDGQSVRKIIDAQEEQTRKNAYWHLEHKQCQKKVFDVIKPRATEICKALQSARREVPAIIEILLQDSGIGYIAQKLEYHYLWNLVTSVLYFKPRERLRKFVATGANDEEIVDFLDQPPNAAERKIIADERAKLQPAPATGGET